jgi:DNA-binding GntR family transcriptional regulator
MVSNPQRKAAGNGYRSLKEIVYDYILTALKDGRLRPGDRILQSEICDALEVSRTPVREALLQLEPLGLVSFMPRKRIVVNGLTEDDVKDLFETIAPLEATAARLATPHLTEEDFAGFEKSLATMQGLIARRQLQALNHEMEAFHGIHLARCPNKLMVSTIRLLKRRFYDPPHRLAFVPEWERQMFAEHERLVELFRNRDVEGVVQFMHVHWSWEHNQQYALKSYFSPIAPAGEAEPAARKEKARTP